MGWGIGEMGVFEDRDHIVWEWGNIDLGGAKGATESEHFDHCLMI